MQKTTRALNERELNLILKNIDIKYRLLLLVEVNTGLRISDAIRLKIENIKKNKIEIIEKKTGKSQIIDINKKFVKFILKNKVTNGKYLFIEGKNIEREVKNFIRCIQNNIKKACKKANIDSKFISTHSFRKTFATTIYNMTKDIVLVKEMLNHSSVLTTQRYININKDRISKIRKKFQIGF